MIGSLNKPYRLCRILPSCTSDGHLTIADHCRSISNRRLPSTQVTQVVVRTISVAKILQLYALTAIVRLKLVLLTPQIRIGRAAGAIIALETLEA